MKLSDAMEHGKNKYWSHAHIRRNPSNPSQWFVMLACNKEKPHMLVDDHENPIVSKDLNHFVELIKTLGIREFTVVI